MFLSKVVFVLVFMRMHVTLRTMPCFLFVHLSIYWYWACLLHSWRLFFMPFVEALPIIVLCVSMYPLCHVSIYNSILLLQFLPIPCFEGVFVIDSVISSKFMESFLAGNVTLGIVHANKLFQWQPLVNHHLFVNHAIYLWLMTVLCNTYALVSTCNFGLIVFWCVCNLEQPQSDIFNTWHPNAQENVFPL